MPSGLTHTRIVVIFGFFLLISTNMMLGKGVDVTQGVAIPKSAMNPGGNYQKEITVDAKTGEVSTVPIISEQARQQSGGTLKQDPEELRR